MSSKSTDSTQPCIINYDIEEQAVQNHVTSFQQSRAISPGYIETHRRILPRRNAEDHPTNAEPDRDDRDEKTSSDIPDNSLAFVSWFQRLCNVFCHKRISESTPSAQPTSTDNEESSERLEYFREGIPQLAYFLDSDKNFNIFGRVGREHCRILWERLMELRKLSEEWDQIDREDAADENRRYRLRTAACSDEQNIARIQFIDNFEKKLKNYVDLYLTYTTMRALGQPTIRDHRAVQGWIAKEHPVFPEEQNFLPDINDLVTAKWKEHQEGHNSFVEDKIESYLANNPHSPLQKIFCKLLHTEQSSKTNNPGLIYYPFEALRRLARFILAFVAVTFLLTPALILFLIPMARGGMAAVVLGSVFSFALALSFLSDSKELLVGIITFTAVLVTFLGNVNSGYGAITTLPVAGSGSYCVATPSP